MKANSRRHVRRTLGYRAKIVASDGSWGRNCRVMDVSEGGAKLMTDEPIELPRDFLLALAMSGKATRKCEVVWKDDCEIGVAFTPDAK